MDNVTPAFQISRQKLSEEKSYLEMEMDKIKFLFEIEEDISTNFESFLQPVEVISLRYNLLKYEYILMNKFMGSLTANALESLKP